MRVIRPAIEGDMLPPIFTCLLLLVAAATTAFISPQSIISFSYFLAIAILVNNVFKFNRSNLIVTFSVSTLLMLLLLVAQQQVAPAYLGMTPGQLGIGTDDVFFYCATTSYYPDALPLNAFRIHEYHGHPFALFLKALTFIPGLFINTLPIDILFACVFAAAFTPLCVMKVTDLLTDEIRVARTAFWLSLFCPLYVANGLIMLRDGWTATLLVMALLFLLQERFLHLFISVGVLSFIRLASGLELGFMLAAFVFLRYTLSGRAPARTKLAVLFLIVGAPIVAGLAGPQLLDYIQRKVGTNPFYRSVYLDTVTSSEGSIYGRIMNSHPLIRMTLGPTFFFFAPYMTMSLWSKGYFLVRTVFGSLFGLLNVFYVYGFVNAFFASRKNKNTDIYVVILGFIAMTYFLSQYSMQFRHKTMIMPLYYVAVAYGFAHWTKWSRGIAFGVSVALLGVQLYILLG